MRWLVFLQARWIDEHSGNQTDYDEALAIAWDELRHLVDQGIATDWLWTNRLQHMCYFPTQEAAVAAVLVLSNAYDESRLYIKEVDL